MGLTLQALNEAPLIEVYQLLMAEHARLDPVCGCVWVGVGVWVGGCGCMGGWVGGCVWMCVCVCVWSLVAE